MMDSSVLVYKNVKIVHTKQDTTAPLGWDVLANHGGGADWEADGHEQEVQADTEMVSDDEEVVDFFDDRSECSTIYEASDSEIDVLKSFKKRAHSRNLLPDDLAPETDFIDE